MFYLRVLKHAILQILFGASWYGNQSKSLDMLQLLLLLDYIAVLRT